jgi:hypothetical protein
VLLTIDSGAVTTYGSTSENEAVSGLRVITPASAIHLKNSLDPNKTGFSIEHIIKYMSANPQNVFGATVFNHEDVSYLLSLVEGVNPSKSMLYDNYLESTYILSSTSNYPSQARNTFSSVISSAQDVLNQSNSKQRQVDEALLSLMNAQHVYLSEGYSLLETDQTDPDLEIAGNMIFVPYEMSVPTLISKLTPAVEIHAAAEDSTLVTAGNVTGTMKVVISSIPSQIYHIRIHAVVSTIEQLNSALADPSVSLIKLTANITTDGDIHINHYVHFTASQEYTIAYRNLTVASSFSHVTDKVKFVKHVNSEAELLNALLSWENIEVVESIDEFTGLLERAYLADYEYYRSVDDHSRAFVAHANQLRGALLDAEVTNIYIAQENLYVSGTLTFPERWIVLSGSNSTKATLRASSITNTLIGNSEAINIVNDSAPFLTHMSWGNGEAGILRYNSEYGQVISLKFSSALGDTAIDSVEEALIAGASNDPEILSVINATYLNFDWYDNNTSLDVRNMYEETMYFLEDVYAQLSNLPHSNTTKILDPILFKGGININLEDNVLEVSFNEPISNVTLSQDVDQIIESLFYTRYEYDDEIGTYIPIKLPINYTSVSWDMNEPLFPILMIEFDDENVDYGGRIDLIFKSSSIRNIDNESLYNVISHAG